MKKVSIFLLTLLLIANNIFAGNETIVLATKLKDINTLPLQVSNGIQINDNKYGQLPVLFSNKNTEGRIVLKFDQASTYILASNNSDFKIKIEYLITDIKDKNQDAVPNNTTLRTLEIEYKSMKNELVKDIDIFSFNNVSSFKVKVTAILINDNSINFPLGISSLPENIILEQQIISERFYTQPTVTPIWSLNNKIKNLNNGVANDEAEIYWNFIPGFEEYELEWVFVNNYKDDNSPYADLPDSDVKFNFLNNSTKIRIKENYFSIPLVFDKGYIVYRVRGVTKTGSPDFLNESFSVWSLYPINDGSISTVKGVTNNIHWIKTNAFEDSINWQYIATYAEWGLNKTMLNFMDGTLRSRQNVTKNNSDKEVLVSETVYDYQGRPAVQILPAPVPGTSQTIENSIAFYERFNQSESVVDPSNLTQKLSFSKKDFDYDGGTDACTPNLVNKINSNFGAGQYYSINNPDKTGFNSYIPDANGYSFIQTEYTRDNTGKLRRKGNVGEAFQLSSNGKFTEYMYQQPNQTQLNRLFGCIAGKNEHFQRNVVIDPNGQSSVSYLNLSGKVVATSLEGTSPPNLDGLENNNAGFQIAEDILSSGNDPDDNYTLLKRLKAIPVSQDGVNHSFHYEIKEIPTYSDTCMNGFCYECAYDLAIELKNTDCNIPVYSYPPDSTVLGKIGSENVSACGVIPPFNLDFGPLLLNKANYTLNKELSIDESILDNYAEHYGDTLHNDCYKEFISPAMYTRGCFYNCDSCNEDLGGPNHTFASFKVKHAATLDSLSEEGKLICYNNKIKECELLCKKMSICEVTRQQMLADVSPNGQYGKVLPQDVSSILAYSIISYYIGTNFNNFINGTLNIANILSIIAPYASSVFYDYNWLPQNNNGMKNWRNPIRDGVSSHYLLLTGDTAMIEITNGNTAVVANANIITNADGRQFIYPEDLADVNIFLKYWQPTFANELVEHHPEYCYYKWCKGNTDTLVNMGSYHSSNDIYKSSNDFDDELYNITKNNDLAEIIAALRDSTYHPDLLKNNTALMLNDPFFTDLSAPDICENKRIMMGISSSSILKNRQDFMIAYMKNYKNGKSIDKIAWEMNNCVTYYPSFDNSTACPTPDAFNLRITPLSIITYINLYLDCKNKVKDIAADCYALNTCGCFNECIGKPDFEPVEYGMIPSFYLGHYSQFWNLYTWNWSSSWFNNLELNYQNNHYRGYPYYGDACQPCSKHNFWKFNNENFNKRYFKSNSLSKEIFKTSSGDPEADGRREQADVQYNQYLLSGQCPTDRALETFLNAKAKPDSSTGVGNLGVAVNGTDNLANHTYSFAHNLYEAMNGSTTASTPDLIHWSDISDASQWKFKVLNRNTNFEKYITILKLNALPASTTVDSIVKIDGLRFIIQSSNVYKFSVFVTIREIGAEKTYSCEGRTDFVLGGCFNPLDTICTISRQSTDVLKIAALMTNIIAGNYLSPNPISTTYSDVSANSLHYCHPASFSIYFGKPKTVNVISSTNSSAYLKWKAENTTTNPVFYIQRNFASGNPVILKIEISNLQITPNHSYLFKKIYDNAGVYYISIDDIDLSNPSNPSSYVRSISISFENLAPFSSIPNYYFASNDFPYSNCKPPKANSCDEQKYKNPVVVKTILDELIREGKLVSNTPHPLVPGPVWTEDVKAAFSAIENIENLRWISTTNATPTTQKLNGRIYYLIENGTSTPIELDLFSVELSIVGNNIPANYFTYLTTINTSTNLAIKTLAANPAIDGDETYDFVMLDQNNNNNTYIFTGNSNLNMRNCVICDPGSTNYKLKKICTFETTDTFTSDIQRDSINSFPEFNKYKIMTPEQLNSDTNLGCPIIVPSINKPMMVYNSSNLVVNKILWQHTIKYKSGAKYKFLADLGGCIETGGIGFKVTCKEYPSLDYESPVTINPIWNTYHFARDINTEFFTAPLEQCIISQNNTCTLTFQIIIRNSQSGYIFIDNVKILEENPCIAEPSVIKHLDTIPNPCPSYLAGVALNNKITQDMEQLKTLKMEFKHKYRKHCLEMLKDPRFQEIFNMTAPTAGKEYQYTLYYYDQAGNLVQTVPPQGVRPVTASSLAENVAINNERNLNPDNPDPNYLPTHAMTTSYKYNSLNQVMEQSTPDAGITRFWYDEIGRIAFSQNAIQFPNKYSYTFYDEFGRIREVGEIQIDNNDFLTNNTSSFITNIPDIFMSINNNGYDVHHSKSQITVTNYDFNPYSLYPNTFTQENLRNRVASIAIFNTFDDLYAGTYIHATHYSYDIHGNVNTLVQENRLIATINPSQQFKKLNYEYDLVSGKVNKVIYQANEMDQFMHRYEYDADNRITHVLTSQDGIIWEKDAKYFYYKHGPLARTEIGDLAVQGIDYAYTLQGWIKGINSNILDASIDIGKDGMQEISNLHKKFANDLASYSLKYYADDYKPIEQNLINNPINFVATTNNISNLATESPDLYNGNISHMVSTIMDENNNISPQLTGYRYDQLNRIKQMKTVFEGGMAAITNNDWNSDLKTKYAETYRYDANGNIAELTRNDASGTAFDNLEYDYSSNNLSNNSYPTTWPLIDNKLTGVTQTAGSMTGQFATTTYTYNAIGNLIADATENITNIEWNVYGKIKYITKSVGDDIAFIYDAMGNRICKKVIPKSGDTVYHFYTRDAQGNIMATYKTTNMQTTLTEFDLYGSSRIGIKALELLMQEPTNPDITYSRILGNKRYEISNHLGNVLTTFSDRKIALGTLNNPITGYDTYLVSAQDYTPFGMQMIGRGKNAVSGEYRFGFNGKEKDDEVKGTGNSLDYGARIYDPRIGRWLSLDPERDKYPSWSAYSFSIDNPIKYTDKGGRFVVDPALKEKYPKVALIIENAQLLYNNKELPPDVKKALKGVDVQKIFDDNFRDAFEEFSTLNKQQIQEVVAPNSGPMITGKNLTRLNQRPSDTREIKVNGYNDVVWNDDGPTNENITRKEDGKKGREYIDEEVLDVIEYELGGSVDKIGNDKKMDIGDKNKSFKTFIATLFHESVHYGRNETGAGNTNCGEKGQEFENKAFKGEDTNRLKRTSLKNND